MKCGVLFGLLLSMYSYASCESETGVRQDPLVVAEVGSSVILPCFHSVEMVHSVSWYKLTLGKKPLLIGYSAHLSGDVEYKNGFDELNRFFFDVGTGYFNLRITDLKENDFAYYYCTVIFMNMIEFGEGTILMRKGEDFANGPAVVQQPVSDRRLAGDSVTLQCSVVSQMCAGEYSVYWFRHSAGSSPPGIIYSHENRSGQCEERSEDGSSTQSCVYSLSQTPLTAADAGLYYCAVATCGVIVFGNGTKLTIEVSSTFGDPVVPILFTISIASIIVNIFLAKLIHKYYKKASKQHRKQRNQIGETDTLQSLNYVALSFSKNPTSKRPSVKTREEETVYYN